MGLRIALTADPELAVPPRLYGGIERVVDMLAQGLTERGHEVTLFAHPASTARCRRLPYPGLRSRSVADLLMNTWHVSTHVLRGDYDLVHGFGRLAYLLPLLPLRTPKLMSYQRSITARSVAWATLLARGTLHFSACSRSLMAGFLERRNWHVVHNGVPIATYEFRDAVASDAPLVFLGRIEEIKGAHLAIEVARRSGFPLLIAGNVPCEEKHESYFRTAVEPHLDGRRARYIGPVDDLQKNALLGRAAALLMPVLWDEPFGIVMAEALACGTPVIGLDRGAVSEIVENGVTGFVCSSVDEMHAAIPRIGRIDRRACRRAAEERFSNRAVVEGYLAVYSQLLDRAAESPSPGEARAERASGG